MSLLAFPAPWRTCYTLCALRRNLLSREEIFSRGENGIIAATRAILPICHEKELIALDRVSLILVIIGALNWLLVGLFQFDFVSWVFGGQTAVLSRIVYSLVGIAGLWSISLLFRDREPVRDAE